jgi:hypothetical protein
MPSPARRRMTPKAGWVPVLKQVTLLPGIVA